MSAGAVTWPNGALGCPQPGFVYTERIEPGYQVVVDAGGRQLDYRVGSGGTPTFIATTPLGRAIAGTSACTTCPCCSARAGASVCECRAGLPRVPS